MMTKIERVKRAFEGKDVDYVPFAIWRHFDEVEKAEDGGAAAHVAFYRESGIDFTKVMDENGLPFDAEIKVPSDWRKVRKLPLTNPAVARQLDLAKRVADALADECLVFATMFSPYLCAGISAGGARGHFYGDALMNIHLRTDPEPVGAAFEAIAETKIAMAEDLLRHGGIAGFYFSSQGAEAGKYPEELFAEHIKASDLLVLSHLAAKGKYNILHICGADMRMEQYADYPCDAVNWAVARNAITMSQGREIFKKTIYGGINNRGAIVGGDEAGIAEEVRSTIREFGPKGLILGGDCTIPPGLAMSRLHCVTKASRCFAATAAKAN